MLGGGAKSKAESRVKWQLVNTSTIHISTHWQCWILANLKAQVTKKAGQGGAGGWWAKSKAESRVKWQLVFRVNTSTYQHTASDGNELIESTNSVFSMRTSILPPEQMIF